VGSLCCTDQREGEISSPHRLLFEANVLQPPKLYVDGPVLARRFAIAVGMPITGHPQFILPDLAESWSWSSDYTRLSFRLRQGAKWHDGQPFTAKVVKCTWDMLAGKSADKLRLNPRKAWYRNLDEVKTDGDYAATFVLKRPQPAFLMLLASGMSPVYPCHVSSREMRSHPIGTGPFKFVVFKPNE
jgi:peptide/nickel transport system substrate-binding protein